MTAPRPTLEVWKLGELSTITDFSSNKIANDRRPQVEPVDEKPFVSCIVGIEELEPDFVCIHCFKPEYAHVDLGEHAYEGGKETWDELE